MSETTPAMQRERVEEGEELGEGAAGVEDGEIGRQVEGHADQHVADRDAEDQRGHGAADEERPVPGAAPGRAFALRAVFEGDGTEDQRGEDHEHREVEAREAGRVEDRPSGEDRAAAEDEPDLVALPHRADGVDRDPAFGVGVADEGQKRAHAHVETVGQREADEKDAEQQPPDEAEHVIADEGGQDHGFTLPVSGRGSDRRWSSADVRDGPPIPRSRRRPGTGPCGCISPSAPSRR